MDTKIISKNTVNMHNYLTRAKQILSKSELKLLRLAVSFIFNKPDSDIDSTSIIQKDFIDTDNYKDLKNKYPEKTVTVSASDYSNLFGSGHSFNYNHLRDTLKQLYNRSIVLKTAKKTITFRWITRAEYNHQNAEMVITFSSHCYPFLNDLAKDFTSFPIDNIADLNKVYAVRIYELAESWVSFNKKIELTIDELRHTMAIPSSFKWSNIKQRCLDDAINEVEEKTNMRIKYQAIRKGRSIKSVIFEFNYKKKIKKDSNQIKKTEDLNIDNTIDSNELNTLISVDTKKPESISQKEKIKYIKYFKKEEIEKNINILLGDEQARTYLFKRIPLSSRKEFLKSCFDNPSVLDKLTLSRFYNRLKSLDD